MNQKHIAIFASGQGSNASKIIEHFTQHDNINVSLLITNNQKSKIIDIAELNGIPFHITNKKEFFSEQSIVSLLQYHKINFIVLAGFLWKLPNALILSFPNQIINIHPALLPKFGGNGMYGMHVHDAVLKAGEKESGVTIHYVNEELDKGDIIFQAKCKVETSETIESLTQKIRKLEHDNYANIIEQILS